MEERSCVSQGPEYEQGVDQATYQFDLNFEDNIAHFDRLNIAKRRAFRYDESEIANTEDPDFIDSSEKQETIDNLLPRYPEIKPHAGIYQKKILFERNSKKRRPRWNEFSLQTNMDEIPREESKIDSESTKIEKEERKVSPKVNKSPSLNLKSTKAEKTHKRFEYKPVLQKYCNVRDRLKVCSSDSKPIMKRQGTHTSHTSGSTISKIPSKSDLKEENKWSSSHETVSYSIEEVAHTNVQPKEEAVFAKRRSTLKPKDWKESEDTHLIKCVNKHKGNWKKIEKEVNKNLEKKFREGCARVTSKQCMQKYQSLREKRKNEFEITTDKTKRKNLTVQKPKARERPKSGSKKTYDSNGYDTKRTPSTLPSSRQMIGSCDETESINGFKEPSSDQFSSKEQYVSYMDLSSEHETAFFKDSR
ncbi:unnamed protein product [Moneuplotes crassus]|uniref:Myb-like domain-containing protein n=1 Tax=Euplotes crassus TaxID=5936 RepID=A0AAD1Y440_EUPCR|nr:unnamed protein product [Moneuplotes crassus]